VTEVNPFSKLNVIGIVPDYAGEVFDTVLNEKPLFHYVIDALENCDLVKSIFLSKSLNQLGDKCFTKVQRQTLDREDLITNFKELGESYCLVKMTNPQITSKDIFDAMDVLQQNPNADSVKSVIESDPVPGRVWKLDRQMVPYFKGSRPFDRRQDQIKGYIATQDIIIVRNRISKNASLEMTDESIVYGYEMKSSRTFDIRSPADVETVKYLMEGE
jgi:CMP-N-acetylneuraminic acid synthetase